MIKECLSSSAFKGNLLEVTAVEDFKAPTSPSNGDCIVLNTNASIGEHWFPILYSDNKWFLFDCLLLTPIADHVKIIKEIKSTGKRFKLQTGQLQGLGSMTCGEHSICFLFFVTATFSSTGISYCFKRIL